GRRGGGRVGGVGKNSLEAALLEDLVAGNPINPGGLHCHGLDSALDEPIGQPLKVGSEGAELAHRLGGPDPAEPLRSDYFVRNRSRPHPVGYARAAKPRAALFGSPACAWGCASSPALP